MYIEKPFDHKVLKNDLGQYLDADEDLIRCQTKMEYYQMMLNYLDVPHYQTILNRTYQLKNAIEWQKFIRGYD